MKKILLSILGYCLLASFTVNTNQPINTKDIAFECPECKKEFKESMKKLRDAYLNEVTIACDKFKEGKITSQEYNKARNEARAKNNKPESDCMTTFNNCCQKETKEIMDREEQDKESVN